MSNTPNIEVQEIGVGRLTLTVPLTEPELLDRGDQLATRAGDYEEAAAIKKMVTRRLGRRVKSLEDERSRLAGIIRAQKEKRPIQVRIEAHLSEGVAKYISTEGANAGEVVKERQLSAAERDELNQGELPLKSSPKDFTPNEEPGDDVHDPDDVLEAVTVGLDVDPLEAVAFVGEIDDPVYLAAAEEFETANAARPVVMRALDIVDLLIAQGA